MKRIVVLSLLLAPILYTQLKAASFEEVRAKTSARMRQAAQDREQANVAFKELKAQIDSRRAEIAQRTPQRPSLPPADLSQFDVQRTRDNFALRMKIAFSSTILAKENRGLFLTGETRLTEPELFLLKAALAANIVSAEEITPEKQDPQRRNHVLYYPEAIIEYDDLELAEKYFSACQSGWLPMHIAQATFATPTLNSLAMLESYASLANKNAQRSIGSYGLLPFTPIAATIIQSVLDSQYIASGSDGAAMITHAKLLFLALYKFSEDDAQLKYFLRKD